MKAEIYLTSDLPESPRTLQLYGWCCLVSLLTMAAPARGALTWQMCVQEAVGKNPDIAVAVEGVNSAEALYKGAYSNFFPQISATAGFTQNSAGVASTTGAGGAVINAPGNGPSSIGTFNEGLTATQSIFNGFQDVGKVKQGKANLEAARAGLAIAKSALSSNLKGAFAQLLYSQDAVSLAATILKRQEANLRMVTIRFEGGQENKGSQLYQAATVSQAKYQYDHSVRQKLVAIKQLGAYIGQPDVDVLEVVGELQVKDPPRNVDLRKLAILNPNHQQIYYQRISADAGITIANQGWYPNVSLTGFVGKTGQDFPPAAERWSVGTTISFPFFPGTSQIYNSENAHAVFRQAEFTETSADNKLIAALEQAYGGFLDAIQQVRVAQEFQDAAKARSVIATEKYNTGLMTFEDWSVIETDYINRQQTLLQSKLNAMQAEATWEGAEGTGDIP